MKLAISGKGGVGKSTLAAALSLLMVQKHYNVLAVDADPDANLAAALGIPKNLQEQIIPISEQVALIEERTGAKVKQYGQIFKLNPEVSDIAGGFATNYNGVALLVLGAIQEGGSGCACPESVLIRSLISDLILYKKEAVVMDMEAGIEHLGRATARGVSTLLIILEPGQRSIDSTKRIIQMARDVNMNNIQLVANKIMTDDDIKFIKDALPEWNLIGEIPYSDKLRGSDRSNRSVLDGMDEELRGKFEAILNVLIG
jgi:CO dehydrogenase maturation factor